MSRESKEQRLLAVEIGSTFSIIINTANNNNSSSNRSSNSNRSKINNEFHLLRRN